MMKDRLHFSDTGTMCVNIYFMMEQMKQLMIIAFPSLNAASDPPLYVGDSSTRYNDINQQKFILS